MPKTGLGRNIIARIIGPILKAVSPVIRNMIEEFLGNAAEAAAETDNEIDDFLVERLQDLLGFEN